MEKFISNCPGCGSGLKIRNLGCGECGLNLEGKIELPKLARMTPDDRELIEVFVLSSGSLKEVGKILGMSYPTVRIRLDKVIKNLQALNEQQSPKRLEVLEKLEKGKISTEEALEQLKEFN